MPTRLPALLRICCVVALTLRSGARMASADEAVAHSDRGARSGLAVGVGFGNETAGLGGVVHYYQQIPDSRFRVALHAGVGGQWLGSNASDYRFRPAASGGVSGTFGRRQRFLFDLWGGPTGVYQTLSLHGEPSLEWRPLYGLGLNVGWEWVSRRGFIMRSSLGPAYAFLPRIYRDVGTWSLSGNLLTLGYKLW